MSFMYFSGHPAPGMSPTDVISPGARTDGVLVLNKSQNADIALLENALSKVLQLCHLL